MNDNLSEKKFEDSEGLFRRHKSRKGQTMQWLKEKGQTMIYKTLHRIAQTVQHEPQKQRGWTRALRKSNSFLLHVLLLLQTWFQVINEKKMGLWLRQID